MYEIKMKSKSKRRVIFFPEESFLEKILFKIFRERRRIILPKVT
ncbi:hypothetical protein [Deferribacter autotrophicus]|nr:hypothetical protein [Deferribacter autotrophicus]